MQPEVAFQNTEIHHIENLRCLSCMLLNVLRFVMSFNYDAFHQGITLHEKSALTQRCSL